MSAAVIAGILAAAGTYLLLQRSPVRIAFGFVLLGHALNVVLLSAGGLGRNEAPLLDGGQVGQMADPLPQAFALTAIVISFAITLTLLGLIWLSTVQRSRRRDDQPAADREPAVDAVEGGL